MKKTTTTVYLLRHAESEANPSIPEPDWPLSVRGQRQAQALSRLLPSLGIDIVYSSPYRRALQTVAPFAQRQNLSIRADARLRERTLTSEWVDNHEQAIKETWADFDLTHPGGESSAACQHRMQNAIDELSTRHRGQTILVSSHGNAISLYLNSIDASFSFDDWRAMKKPDLFRVRKTQWTRVVLNLSLSP